MGTFITIFLVMVLAFAVLGWFADRTEATKRTDGTPAVRLLPGDIKYESPSGNVRVYFPIMTSLIISVVLSLVLRLFS
jgi:hypothetical protein